MTESRTSIPSILRRSGFFGTVSDELLDRIARMARLVTYEKGDTVFAEGAPCAGMYIVATGMVKIYKIGADGREHVIHVAEEGDTFGEVAMFLGSAGYPAYAGAVKKSEVLFIPKSQMLELLESESRLAFQVLASLASWTHKLVTKLELLTLKDASSRLAGYLIAHSVETNDGGAELELSVPKHTLASQLAISSETLSRLLSRFEAQDLIESSGRRVSIPDIKELQQVADWGSGE